MKKLFSIILCVLIIINCGAFSVSSFATKTYNTWEEAYRDLVSTLDDTEGVWDNYALRIGLFDMDNNGVPELYSLDGGFGHGHNVNFYTFRNNQATYVGCETFCLGSANVFKNSEYSGIIAYSRSQTQDPEYPFSIICQHWQLKNNSIISEDIYTVEFGKVQRITKDKRLFNLCFDTTTNGYNETEYLTDLKSAIICIGWESILLFSGVSTQYYNDIAIMCSDFCEAANNTYSNRIKSKYNDYGFKNVKSGNYGFQTSSAYTFGYKTFPASGTILAITLRGTTSIAEGIGDNQKGDLQPFLTEQIYDNIFDYEEEVWNALQNYVNSYPDIQDAYDLTVLVTGHSLGGAAASTIAARLNYSIKNGSVSWLKNAKKESVHAYTFGAIKVFFEEGDNITLNINKGYENIHNIYNYYDTYGPNGSKSGLEVGSIYDKYGHTELFRDYYSEDIDAYANHQIANYRESLEAHHIKCNGKDTDINTDNNSNFWSMAFTAFNRALNIVKDFEGSFIQNMVNAVATVAGAVVSFISGLFGG